MGFRKNGILPNRSRKQPHKMGFSCQIRLFLTILYKQKSENGIFLLNQAVFGNSLQAENSKMGSHFSENVLYPCLRHNVISHPSPLKATQGVPHFPERMGTTDLNQKWSIQTKLNLCSNGMLIEASIETNSIGAGTG